MNTKAKALEKAKGSIKKKNARTPFQPATYNKGGSLRKDVDAERHLKNVMHGYNS
jgi:hypothetical protein